MQIEESGVVFGNFNEEMCFHIEKANFYKNKLKDDCIKSTEFMLFKDNPARLFIVEAKTTAPNVSSQELKKKCKVCEQQCKAWDLYKHEVETKFSHTLTMQSLLYLDRLEEDGIPSRFTSTSWKKDLEIYLVLVITSDDKWYKNKDYISQIQEALRKQCKPLLRLWNAELLVYNKEMALKKKLIVQP